MLLAWLVAVAVAVDIVGGGWCVGMRSSPRQSPSPLLLTNYSEPQKVGTWL